MKDFFSFRRMLTPFIIQILFWLMVILSLVLAIISFVKLQILLGFSTLILGPILARIACEILIVFFRINTSLTDIRNYLLNKE